MRRLGRFGVNDVMPSARYRLDAEGPFSLAAPRSSPREESAFDLQGPFQMPGAAELENAPRQIESFEAEAFRAQKLPPRVRQAFARGPRLWLDAIKEAIAAGIRGREFLADLLFFMQHGERMSAGVGRAVDRREEQFHKLRAEWTLCRTIVGRILEPASKPTVFLPALASTQYEAFVAAPTTGRITLMLNGRNADGSDGFSDRTEAFDSMQQTVESLNGNDALFIANWQFNPTMLPLTLASSSGPRWADLLKVKAAQGVTIRVIIAQHPTFSPFMSNLGELDALIAQLPILERDNFKYIVSPHADPWGTHHQKFVIARKGSTKIAFCGGLDISVNRTPPGWSKAFVWHDIGAKLEGRIAGDLEREFVGRWNREKSRSTGKPLPGWKPHETLTQAPMSSGDQEAGKNQHNMQMLRTVSFGKTPSAIQRDDIWRGYFQLIGRATRFLYLENQYFHEPALADAIVRQAEAQPGLIVLVMVGTGTDDRQAVDPTATGVDRFAQQAQVNITNHGFALRHEFFQRLSVGPLAAPQRLRVYTLSYRAGILHSKFILADDEALSIGSCNANPRGFFFDSELNVMLDDAEAVKIFRHRLWSHNLGVSPAEVASWSVKDFFDRWDAIAQRNAAALAAPGRMQGEGIVSFRPLDAKDTRFRRGQRSTFPVVPDVYL
jgi:phosphatidylserine/phosphatidylglycerophosphate/cardiolipin synthase-like enzyme